MIALAADRYIFPFADKVQIVAYDLDVFLMNWVEQSDFNLTCKVELKPCTRKVNSWSVVNTL